MCDERGSGGLSRKQEVLSLLLNAGGGGGRGRHCTSNRSSQPRSHNSTVHVYLTSAASSGWSVETWRLRESSSLTRRRRRGSPPTRSLNITSIQCLQSSIDSASRVSVIASCCPRPPLLSALPGSQLWRTSALLTTRRCLVSSGCFYICSPKEPHAAAHRPSQAHPD